MAARSTVHPCYRQEPTKAQKECLADICRTNGYSPTYGWSKPIVFEYLARRDGPQCGICHRELDRTIRMGPWKATLDHIISRYDGGPDEFENVQLAHSTCNSSKGSWSGLEMDIERTLVGTVFAANSAGASV